MAYPQVTFKHTVIPATSLVGRRRRAVASSTLQYQLDVLKKTGRYDAFKLKWHPVYDEEPEVWPVPNHLFWDSDVAKWIEGACYILQQEELPDIDAAVKELVEMIRTAQQPDGYLNIHYTVVQPDKRFSNLRDMHELYNCGHLIEAALAHNDHYGNDLLMEPIVKYVNLLCDKFGPNSGQTHGYPGHPEIELALLRLYERTQDSRHLELARYFLLERGNPTGCDGRHYYDVEAEKRGDDPSKRPAFYPEPRCMWYHQAQAPIKDQETIEGHSVRAMYLLTAVADLLRLDNSPEQKQLHTALYRLWDNMVGQKMYVTGGIGAIKQWEGFGQDYYLPQSTDEGGCYSETCAAIGIMMLANRILQTDLHARFGDIMELCLYNAVLTSMSHDGQRFTYVNQLASSDADASKREDWFTVACCPPNVLRLLGQIGGYIWDVRSSSKIPEVVVHLYISSSTTFKVGQEKFSIKQESNYPWKSDISFETNCAAPVAVKLRIPEWAQEWEVRLVQASPDYTDSIQIKPNCPNAVKDNGYLSLPADWIMQNAKFTLTLPLKPRWIAPNPACNRDIVTLARGPVIYCVEDVDNTWVEDHFKTTYVNPSASLLEQEVADKASGDIYTGISLQDGAHIAHARVPAGPFEEITQQDAALGKAKILPSLHFVPYYFRANRQGRGHMRVGLRRFR
ncbi:hypothetical protein AMS68_001854 [Peltaster fructicola]|uniref:DUF1680 domain protein n=1 Tax=Peltaster fructicola TaxID=286661 RepID=A0A6H0XNK1_9PEZI|nr:hypothetical protein AMS68_001854 [Peltaster fructicola]